MDFGFIVKVIMKDVMTCKKQSSVTEKTFCLFSNAVFMETKPQKGEKYKWSYTFGKQKH